MENEVRRPTAKQQFSVEYVFDKVGRHGLWSHLVTPSGLSAWFADDVLVKKNTYTFQWDKESETAEVVINKQENLVRYHWKDEAPAYYFEFRIETDELTGSTLFTITDFAEEDEMAEAIDLWDTQVKQLKRSLGIPE